MLGWKAASQAVVARADADGYSTGVGLILASATLSAAPSIVGLATAVGLGGAGAIAWSVLFALIIAPLRVADTYFSRTSPPGTATTTPPRSFIKHITRSPGLKPLAWFVLALLVLVSATFIGQTTSQAVIEFSSDLLPTRATHIALVVGALGAALAIAPLRKVAPWLAWIAMTAWIVVLGVSTMAALTAPGLALGAFGRGVKNCALRRDGCRRV